MEVIDIGKGGIKYKYPTRSCRKCKKYPCFDGIEKCSCDFAKYGCTLFKIQNETI